MNNRDDFTQKTKDILRDRAGNRCCNPACLAPTSAPGSSPYMKLNGGRAAHIYAAAPGGKRYNTDMTSERRKDISNGIWLCERCSSTIDQDETAHTDALLFSWKSQSEKKAMQEYNNPHLQTGTFDTEKELIKAKSFINYLSPLFFDLNESIRKSGRYYPDNSRVVLGHVGLSFGSVGWNIMNEFWSFNPSIKVRQDYIIQLCHSLDKLLRDESWEIIYISGIRGNGLKYKPEIYFLTEDDEIYLNSVVQLENNLLRALNEFRDITY
ncbi:hypothetical protein [Pseudoalteromonas sp. SR41-7]|uniref:hypothetical protein n=1 Tax=Pseudoalteromonas sp. SR41-7 TaxID=2760947 RepID=UPI0015FF6B0D|nr:hypothetical protein [Pseudoalteromonas sp. SR41-7]MBB1299198.1 hypothetical protein [Pseudoalteromonas sp. SR41-7]